MKKSKKYYTSVTIVIMILLIILSIFQMNYDFETFNKEYKYVENNMQVLEIVNKFKTNKGCSHIETQSGKKIWFDHASNFNYSTYGLSDFLQIGDTIIKHSGSDTLYIHRNKNKYYFVLKENVGKDPYKINVEKWFKK